MTCASLQNKTPKAWKSLRLELLVQIYSSSGKTLILCDLRIDTGGWSVNYCARFNEATIKYSLVN